MTDVPIVLGHEQGKETETHTGKMHLGHASGRFESARACARGALARAHLHHVRAAKRASSRG